LISRRIIQPDIICVHPRHPPASALKLS